jgi:hypothetical protein
MGTKIRAFAAVDGIIACWPDREAVAEERHI